MPLTIQNVANFPLPGALEIAHNPSQATLIYVAQTGAGTPLSSIDFTTLTTTPSPGGGDAHHIVWDGNNRLWTDEDATSSDRNVYNFDVPGMNPMGSVDTTQNGNSYLAAESGVVWSANPDNDSVNEMFVGGLIANLPSFSGPPVQYVGPLVRALGDVWYISSNNPAGTFQFGNLSGVLTQLPTLSDAVNGMIFDGTNFWYSDTSNQALVQISPAGVILNTVPLGGIPIGLGFDGTYLWVGTILPNTLQVIDLGGVVQANVVPPHSGEPLFITGSIGGFTFVTYVGAPVNTVAQFQIAGPPPVTGAAFPGTFAGFTRPGQFGGGNK